MTQALPAPAPADVEIDGTAVRRLRQLRGHTISTLAPKIPMSIGYLSQIERGRRTRVSPPMFLKLAKALGVARKPEQITRRVT